MSGNVYTKGDQRLLGRRSHRRFRGLSEAQRAALRGKLEDGALDKPQFDAGAKLTLEKDGVYLELAMDKGWISERKRSLVTTGLLGRVLIPDLPFENPDGSPVVLDTDYLGKPRDKANPSPGPFEISVGGTRKLKVWPAR